VGDYDNDGFQHLYVRNFGHNVLYHNNGDGTFTDVTIKAGVDDPRWSTSAAWVDYDHDGRLDLFVANYLDFTVQGNKQCYASTGERDYCTPKMYQPVPARLFHNRGDGTFEDIFKTNLTHEGSNLYINDGHGNFYDASAEFGLLQSTFPYTGFGTEWFDYDNDGHLDLFIANGAVNRMESLRGSPYPFNQNNQLFRNQGDGKKFREMTAVAGPAFALSEVSRGAAFGDINNDGAIDIVVANNNGPARLLLNQARSEE